MAVHYEYRTNISLPDLVRNIKDFLTTYSPPDVSTLMWTLEYSLDADPGNSFYTGPIVYILSKTVDGGDNKIYAKIVYQNDTIYILASPDYDDTTDNTADLILKGSQKNEAETHNDDVAVYLVDETLVTPQDALVCRIKMNADFDPANDLIAKAWYVRQLAPLLDSPNITDRKETDIFFWLSFVREEVGDNPIDVKGYFQHLSFGVCGEILTADVDQGNGVGVYTAASSFALDSELDEDESPRTYCGCGNTDDTAGACICVGNWEGKKTWYYPGTMYGYARDPFDVRFFVNPANVGFDFTELCKYSNYAGVRILTPSYVFGKYAGLWRIIARLPFYYTDLLGLYAGDIVTHTDESGDTHSFILFPFVHYNCSIAAGARRGYGVPLPTEE